MTEERLHQLEAEISEEWQHLPHPCEFTAAPAVNTEPHGLVHT